MFVDGFAFRLLLYTDRCVGAQGGGARLGRLLTQSSARGHRHASSLLRPKPRPDTRPTNLNPTRRDAAMHAKAAAAGPHVHHHHAAAHSPPRVLVLSWHHGLVATLEGQHAAYGPTCRLAKRWVGAQLMGSQLAPEAVELLVGAAFCGPSLAPLPASRITGEGAPRASGKQLRGTGEEHRSCAGLNPQPCGNADGACAWLLRTALKTPLAAAVGASTDTARADALPLPQASCASCSCCPPTPGSAHPCWWTLCGRWARQRAAPWWPSTRRAARPGRLPPCSCHRRATCTRADGEDGARAARVKGKGQQVAWPWACLASLVRMQRVPGSGERAGTAAHAPTRTAAPTPVARLVSLRSHITRSPSYCSRPHVPAAVG